ncbi:hypothetical protein ANN_16498, partial [Periplaneta americana]
SQSKQASLVYRSSARVCVRNCVSIRRPEFECSGPQLEGPEFECSGPQLEGPEFEYSELSLKDCGSRYCELELRVFENKVLRKIFGAKRDEVTGEWRKLHNAELHALYSSPDIIRNIKSRRLRWAGHVARMGESRNGYRVFVGRPEGKRPLRRPRRRWEDNIKMDLREVGYDGREWIDLAQDRDQWRAYVRAAMNLRHRKLPSICSHWVEGKPRKNLNQVTFPDRESNPGHLVSRPDALTVTPQLIQDVLNRLLLSSDLVITSSSFLCKTKEPLSLELRRLRREPTMDLNTHFLKTRRRKRMRTMTTRLTVVGAMRVTSRSSEKDENIIYYYIFKMCGRVAQLVEQLATDWKVRGSIPGGDRIFSRYQTFRTAPRFTQPPIKLSTGSFPGVKGGQSVVPTTPPHSSAESIIVPIFKKGDKTNCSNFRGISLLLTYKILSNILLRRLTPYVDEINGDHQCGFRRNRSTIDQIFSIRQIMEKKWEYKGTVHQLFIDFKKAYDSIKREVLYDILIEFGIPKKLVRLIKMCLSETYRRVRIGQFLSDAFPIHCGLKQGDALSPLLFNFALEQRFPNFFSHGALFEAKVSLGAPRNVYFLVLSVYVL